MTQPHSLLQRRVLGTLITTQMIGGLGLAAGLAVSALLAEEISGSARYAGLGGTFQVLGAALITVPMVRLMAARGRRPGLALGYGLAAAGAIAIVAAAVLGNFPLLLLGSLLFGGSTSSNSQSRYAAADLAEPAHRGRDLAVVVWATTIGSVLGPNLIGPAVPLADALGIPRLAGPYALSILALLITAVILLTRLRPDPLLVAREAARAEHAALTAADPDATPFALHGSIRRGIRVVAARPAAALGLVTMAVGHAVMVSVMVMTPLHMRHGDASLQVIGLVLSIHVLGMFALSPLSGLATDRFGGRAVALFGSAVLGTAVLLASLAAEGHSPVLTLALFLLGVGWSCTLVSGSTLLTNAVPAAERPGAQGAADLAMGLAGGAGGALAGVMVEFSGYQTLALAALGLAAVIPLSAVLGRTRVPA